MASRKIRFPSRSTLLEKISKKNDVKLERGTTNFLNQLENITEDMLAMQKQISFVKDGNILSKN